MVLGHNESYCIKDKYIVSHSPESGLTIANTGLFHDHYNSNILPYVISKDVYTLVN